MPDDITVRDATRADVDTLAQFNRHLAEETEDKTLDPETVRNGVTAVFDEPARGFYLVAERDERVVGSLMITTEWSDWRNGAFWWLQSVYVRPEDRREGVYSALHRAVRRRAQEDDEVCGIRLYVEHRNDDAQNTYEALGMTEAPYRLYGEML
jgi:ribosomal protein S18 acetylase RimI-like enzyme